MTVSAFIAGCAGPTLSPDEVAFFRDARPWGFILFSRNCETPDQIRALTAALRAAADRPDAPILIDQEGGRVQRLGPPQWPAYPAGRRFGEVYARDRRTGLAAARLGARLIAHDLLELGIDVDCLPVLDVPVEGAHDVIGHRAYGVTPEVVSDLGRAAAAGLLEGGVLPVIKHIPGHGRAGVDSHHHLPVVETSRAALETTDFPPFRAAADLPLAMTAHVVYSAIDPDAPATTSKTVIDTVIRGFIGYDGCLMSDDVSMRALSGTIGERTAAALAAGCDLVLHCNGDLAEMTAVAAACRPLEGRARERADRAAAMRRPVESFDVEAARAQFARLTGTPVV
ncbi:beta-N-acetylhexosaminidase [Pinisolibacter aquiterrae]|uniref:beta-N-acetylhexosaminidase n=1 Tax=Pinisolibacter aquiterrae TaxID=2815579 RepID=UPI001C3DB15A|nr:beta-N-acetylhexosaminidase [Pinisolibacter aquiterrae]MBV5264987.1 beta-N-acetylhexosaminidase [Pinisolibacter aquiterrae]MCC8235631.1 beta-N-acetylhexosaminidase [Pinisolibacter aquiterrae]